MLDIIPQISLSSSGALLNKWRPAFSFGQGQKTMRTREGVTIGPRLLSQPPAARPAGLHWSESE